MEADRFIFMLPGALVLRLIMIEEFKEQEERRGYQKSSKCVFMVIVSVTSSPDSRVTDAIAEKSGRSSRFGVPWSIAGGAPPAAGGELERAG